MKLATDAPAHWPPVSVEKWDAARTWNNAEDVAVALDKGFVAAGTPCPIVLFDSRMHDAGVLEVPIQITDRGQTYCVFLYGAGSPQSAAAFAAAKQFVEADGATHAVYYCPEPLADVPPGNAFGPFSTRYVAVYRNPIPFGEYAMWWSTPDDPTFETSKTFALIDAFYRSCDGIETLILGDMIRALRSDHGGEVPRMPLPDESVQIPMFGPSEQFMVFAATPKGLRFLFPIQSTAVRYRERFWKHVGDYVSSIKNSAQALGGVLDPPEYRRGFEWWQALRQQLPQMQATSPIKQFAPFHVMPPGR